MPSLGALGRLRLTVAVDVAVGRGVAISSSKSSSLDDYLILFLGSCANYSCLPASYCDVAVS